MTMLHKAFAPGPWFARKRYGNGSGWPIVWQGWVLLASYALVVPGLGALATAGGAGQVVAALILFLGCTALFLELVRRRTEGGWSWGPGSADSE
jgi:hypothetical protein